MLPPSPPAIQMSSRFANMSRRAVAAFCSSSSSCWRPCSKQNAGYGQHPRDAFSVFVQRLQKPPPATPSTTPPPKPFGRKGPATHMPQIHMQCVRAIHSEKRVPHLLGTHAPRQIRQGSPRSCHKKCGHFSFQLTVRTSTAPVVRADLPPGFSISNSRPRGKLLFPDGPLDITS